MEPCTEPMRRDVTQAISRNSATRGERPMQDSALKGCACTEHIVGVEPYQLGLIPVGELLLRRCPQRASVWIGFSSPPSYFSSHICRNQLIMLAMARSSGSCLRMRSLYHLVLAVVYAWACCFGSCTLHEAWTLVQGLQVQQKLLMTYTKFGNIRKWSISYNPSVGDANI